MTSAEYAVESLGATTAEIVVVAVEEIASMPENAENTSASTDGASNGSTTTNGGGNTVEIPADASEPVQVTTGVGEIVAIAFPTLAGTEAVVVGGVSVYPTEHGAITRVPTQDGGTQTIITLNGPESPTAYPSTTAGRSPPARRLGRHHQPDDTVNSGLATP